MNSHFDVQNAVPGGIFHLIASDIRWPIFRNALRFVDYELVEGDVLEFGVYTGRSLVLLAHAHELNKNGIHKIGFNRRIVGFDSFEGMPDGGGHPRWKKGMFRTNHSGHPFCKIGENVTPSVVRSFFKEYGLLPPFLETGTFEKTLPAVIGTKYTKAAVIHIDCDLYDATKTVLLGIHEILQEGAVVLFDDWFNFRGRKDKGEQRAFSEYSTSQRRWLFVEYQNYATFGKSFVVNAMRCPAHI